MGELIVLLIHVDTSLARQLELLLKPYKIKVQLCSTYYQALACDFEGIAAVVISKVDAYRSPIDICRRLHRQSFCKPILLILPMNDLEMKLAALQAGVDAYLTTPVSARLLAEHIRVSFRKTNYLGYSIHPQTCLSLGSLELDKERFQVKADTKNIPLRKREFSILYYLAENAGNIVSRESISRYVNNSEVDLAVVDVHISNIRRKLAKYGGVVDVIETVYGRGYKFKLKHKN